MIFKYVESEKETASCWAKLDLDICYTMTVDDFNGSGDARVYGIKAEMFYERACIGWEEINDISNDKAYMLELLEVLCENTVTPMALKEVLEDYIVCT